MEILKKNKWKIIICVVASVYIFVMTTPNKEMLEQVQEKEVYSEIYNDTYKKVIDIINTKEKDVVVLQKKIDEIRISLNELRESDKENSELQSTVNTWSTETDKIQSGVVIALDKRIDELENINPNDYEKTKEKIIKDIEALAKSHVDYPKSQAERLLEKINNQEKK